ncbi:MAG: PadR family transcriptional regulator [Frondihabitans sp.]|nr:PadR family transcriptional regulator [Frondihabitans sp.]
MSYVDIVILRHLRLRPAHGYDLRKRVEATTGYVLHNNSMYPALRRFEEAGAVVKTVEAREGRPPRLVYEITAVGRELLHDMLATFPPQEAGNEMEFLARLGQFSLLTTDEQVAILDARTVAVSAPLEHLRDISGLARGDVWGGLVIEEMTRRGEAELDWLAGLRVHVAERTSEVVP